MSDCLKPLSDKVPETASEANVFVCRVLQMRIIEQYFFSTVHVSWYNFLENCSMCTLTLEEVHIKQSNQGLNNPFKCLHQLASIKQGPIERPHIKQY